MKTKKLVICSLFSALLCVLAPISIRLGPIPISFASFIIYIASLLLPTKMAIASVAIYIAIGALGLPVFSNFTGGFGVLVSQAGGFIIGYIPCSVAISLLSKRFDKTKSLAFGTGILYIIGTAFFAAYTHSSLTTSILICVVPFLAGDALKIILAEYVCAKCEKQINRIIKKES